MKADFGHLILSLACLSDIGIGIGADVGCGFTRTGSCNRIAHARTRHRGVTATGRGVGPIARRPDRTRVAGAVAMVEVQPAGRGRATATPSSVESPHSRLPEPGYPAAMAVEEEGEVSEFHRDLASLPDLAHTHANTGPVRERRPVYVDLLPPCNAGCPAGENIQAWLSHTRRAGTSRHGASSSRTIRCRRSTVGSVTTPARASATAPSSTAPCRSTRSSGSWATSRWSRAGSSMLLRSQRQAGARDRGRPEWALGCLSPCAARARGGDSRRGRRTRRDDEVRHPCIPAAT